MSEHTANDGARADTAGSGERWDLCLYVTGQSPKCLRAIENLRRACEEHLAGRYTIEIVDLLKNPRRAADYQILAAPTVVRRLRGRSVSSPATSRTATFSASACSAGGHQVSVMTGSTADDRWILILYVDGASTSSIHAIETVRRVCDEELGGHVDLEVIDVRQQPARAVHDQVVGVPTLIKRFPGPPRRVVGNLSGSYWMRLGLDAGAAGTSGEDRASAG